MKNIPEKMIMKTVLLSSALIFSGISFQACDFFKKKEEEKKSSESAQVEERLRATEKKIDEILAKVTDIQKALADQKDAAILQPEEAKESSEHKNEETGAASPKAATEASVTSHEKHVKEAEKTATASHESEKKEPGEKPKESPDVIYKKATDAYKSKDFKNAALLFDEIISYFPGNDLIDNALYWKGESLFALKKYAETIETFKQLCEKYPDSEKAPTAMLKTGYAYQAMDQKEEAKKYFRKTFITYPFSQPGTVAQSMLEKAE